MKRFTQRRHLFPTVVAALTLGGAVLRLVVARQDLYSDELATYWVVAAHGLADLVETVSTDAEISPPLSFVLSWITTRIGLGEEMLRLSALVAGVASIPLVYGVGARTVDRGAAVLATALTTLSPFMIFYSAEARGYGVLMALLLLSTLALLRGVEGGENRWWVLYGLCVCLSAYTHYTSVFVLAGQLGWALWTHPRARRPLILATAVAALFFVPWLPSLRRDIESPTTDILSSFSPLTLETTRVTLGHWSIGFPYAGPTRSLSDLPGRLSLVMLALSVSIGIYSLVTRATAERSPRRRPGRGLLIVILAVATPVGTAVQSAIGANVFSVRSLAASWPYLAMAVAALVMASRPAHLRVLAATLAVAVFAVGAGTMLTDDFVRTDYSRLARFTDGYPDAVILSGAALSPGPFTNFEVEGSDPRAEVYRLFQPAQKERPFTLGEPLPDPFEVAERGMTAARGGPIIFVAYLPLSPTMLDVIDALPSGYELTATKVSSGMLDVQARVYERVPAR